MTIADWLEAACADADKRGLSELRPMLEALARSTTSLRAADAGAAHHAGDEPPEDDKA